MRMKVLSALCASLVSVGSAFAMADTSSLRIPSQFMSARPAYLGGAFTAVADDQNALFFNPAGLAYLDSTFAAFLDAQSKVSIGSGGLLSMIDDGMKAFKIGGEIADQKDPSLKLDKIIELGEHLSSRTVYAGSQLQGYLARRKWGFALTLSGDVAAGIHSKILPETLDFALISDTDIRIGYAHSFIDDKLSLGISPYYKLRGQGGQANLSFADAYSTTFLDDQISMGQGFGADLGMMIRPVKTMAPTFGLAILNVGDTKFYDAPKALREVTPSTRKPDPLKQVVNAGFSVTPVDGKSFVRISGELREINRPTPSEYKPALGVEGGFRSSFVRTILGVGWGNGGWSAGMELRAFVKLRLSTYIEPNLFFDRVNKQRVWVMSFGL